jgi:hypothetical protein
VFDALNDMLGRGLLGIFILLLLITRLAMKHPKASGGFAKGILELVFRK